MNRRIAPAVAAVLLVAMAGSAMAAGALPPGASTCSGCHGASGPVPVLQGRTPDDVAAAMREFREGRRTATVMDRIARGFSEDEARAIAAAVVVAPEAKAP